jgi:Tfp pilus assembly protein PilX
MPTRGNPRRQEGVVLMIALIVLVAMTLAGLGLIRSIDTGNLVAGNIGFRESATATGDSGIEAARAWMLANKFSLDGDNPAAGYYSTRQDSVDITGVSSGTSNVDWGGTDPGQVVKAFDAGTTLDGTGNHVFYLIQRLCSIPGSKNLPLQSCTVSPVTGQGSTQSAPTYQVRGLLVDSAIYYRVTARVNGPKNAVSYVQAIILML